jgi:hypothetical protein
MNTISKTSIDDNKNGIDDQRYHRSLVLEDERCSPVSKFQIV